MVDLHISSQYEARMRLDRMVDRATRQRQADTRVPWRLIDLKHNVICLCARISNSDKSHTR